MALGRRINGPGWWAGRGQAATGFRMRPGFPTHVTDGRGGGCIEKTWGRGNGEIHLAPAEFGVLPGDSRVGKSGWQLGRGRNTKHQALHKGLTEVCTEQGRGQEHTSPGGGWKEKREHKGVRGSKTGTEMSPLDLVALKWGA